MLARRTAANAPPFVGKNRRFAEKSSPFVCRPVTSEHMTIVCVHRTFAEAFYNDPAVTYVLPDETIRRSVLPWFVQSVAIPASQLCGEVYTTADGSGAALWIRPGRISAFAHMASEAMRAIPFNLDPLTVRRWNSLRAQIERVHQRLAERPHWYLLAVRVEPTQSGKATDRVLFEPVLSRADAEGLPCYVETFDETLLPFYESWGFQIAGAGRIPDGGPNFWTLMRSPNVSSRH